MEHVSQASTGNGDRSEHVKVTMQEKGKKITLVGNMDDVVD